MNTSVSMIPSCNVKISHTCIVKLMLVRSSLNSSYKLITIYPKYELNHFSDIHDTRYEVERKKKISFGLSRVIIIIYIYIKKERRFFVRASHPSVFRWGKKSTRKCDKPE